ncbi:unnamed protein product [Plasmodium vivax]|uniref:(malaria parasite P. vivax) hypothetical protein n=1 Tax=Plasmodium vivax TaxID=5855 RepID=A0A8S4H4Q7_PLAVI|nr:unnamed protein product [Plasmodium vivax]
MNCACQNYIYECINIYNELDQKYCSIPEEKNGVNKSVCDVLDNFKRSYMNDLYNKEGIEDKTPSISSSVNSKDIVGCQEHTKKVTLLSNKDENTGSSISSSIPTAVVTIFGVSSFLSLIYKFTPLGNFFRSRNIKRTNVFNNLDENIEKQLFYPRPKDEMINISNATYNVAYGPE